MENTIQVSVIILTYNPVCKKLLNTLESVVKQKNISFEVIISDDGSKENIYFEEAEKMLKEYDINNYTLLKNKKNLGTVKNICNALKKANGKYVYLISPGDYVYNDTTLSDFYNFAESKNAKICFGDYLMYVYKDNNVDIKSTKYTPCYPKIFNKSFFWYKIAFYDVAGASYVIGPSYFREKNYTIKMMNFIKKYSIYVEDNTSTLYALAEKEPVYYLPQKIVWYETNSGISTSNNSEWNKKMEDDFSNVINALSENYPKDKSISANVELSALENKMDIWHKIKFLLKHPVYSAVIFFVHKKERTMEVSKEETEYISAILKRH